MMQKFAETIDAAYHIGDTRIFLECAAPTVERGSVASSTEMPSCRRATFQVLHRVTRSIKEKKQ